MCRRITCPACGKPTWAGCGQHVEQALAGVPQSERCQGHETQQQTSSNPLGRLFGR